MEKGDIVVYNNLIYRVVKIECETTRFTGLRIYTSYILETHNGYLWRASMSYFGSIKKLKLHGKDI